MWSGLLSGFDPTTLVRLGGLVLMVAAVWVGKRLHVGALLARLVRRA